MNLEKHLQPIAEELGSIVKDYDVDDDIPGEMKTRLLALKTDIDNVLERSITACPVTDCGAPLLGHCRMEFTNLAIRATGNPQVYALYEYDYTLSNLHVVCTAGHTLEML